MRLHWNGIFRRLTTFHVLTVKEKPILLPLIFGSRFYIHQCFRVILMDFLCLPRVSPAHQMISHWCQYYSVFKIALHWRTQNQSNYTNYFSQLYSIMNKRSHIFRQPYTCRDSANAYQWYSEQQRIKKDNAGKKKWWTRSSDERHRQWQWNQQQSVSLCWRRMNIWFFWSKSFFKFSDGA